MKRVILLVPIIIAVCSCFITYQALAQTGLITNPVGTPSCSAQFNDAQGNHCFRINCPASPDAYTNYHMCDGLPITAGLSFVQLCELPNVQIVVAIHCNAGLNPPSISFSWVDGGALKKQPHNLLFVLTAVKGAPFIQTDTICVQPVTGRTLQPGAVSSYLS